MKPVLVLWNGQLGYDPLQSFICAKILAHIRWFPTLVPGSTFSPPEKVLRHLKVDGASCCAKILKHCNHIRAVVLLCTPHQEEGTIQYCMVLCKKVLYAECNQWNHACLVITKC